MENSAMDCENDTIVAKNEENTFTLPIPLGNILRIERKSLRYLPETLFCEPQLQSLTELTLTNSELEVLPENFSSNLVNLKSLNLEGNKFNEFPKPINKLSSLEKLNVSKNKLNELSDELEILGNLQHLDVSNNKITKIPKSLGSLICLKTLNLSQNNISVLPDEIGALLNLRVLDLSNNSLSSLPNSVKDLKVLSCLDVSHNKLKALPDCFDSATLGTLILSHNTFENIPKCVASKLTSVFVLDLSYNFIQFFDVAPKCVGKLVKLNISNNNFTDIPSWLFGEKCRCLRFLDISFNKNMTGSSKLSAYTRSGDMSGVSSTLRHLVASNCCFSSSSVTFLHGLKALEYVDLSNEPSLTSRFGNILCNFPSATLSTCVHLKHLNLRGTAMSLVPDNLGNLSVKLETLDMSVNELCSLPDSFCKLVALAKLDLSSNQLLKLPLDFGALATLEELRLSKNMLHHLPDSFKKLRNLRLLDLYDNSFDEVPPVLLSLSSLEALDLEFNLFKTYDNDKNSVEFIVKYETMRTKLRALLPCDVRGLRQNMSKLECPDDGTTGEEPSPEDNLNGDYEDTEESDLDPSDQNHQEACSTANLPEENWDEHDDPDDNFNPHEVVKRQGSYGPALLVYESNDPLKEEFCPAMFHSAPIHKVNSFCVRAPPAVGQFDDAD